MIASRYGSSPPVGMPTDTRRGAPHHRLDGRSGAPETRSRWAAQAAYRSLAAAGAGKPPLHRLLAVVKPTGWMGDVHLLARRHRWYFPPLAGLSALETSRGLASWPFAQSWGRPLDDGADHNLRHHGIRLLAVIDLQVHSDLCPIRVDCLGCLLCATTSALVGGVVAFGWRMEKSFLEIILRSGILAPVCLGGPGCSSQMLSGQIGETPCKRRLDIRCVWSNVRAAGERC